LQFLDPYLGHLCPLTSAAFTLLPTKLWPQKQGGGTSLEVSWLTPLIQSNSPGWGTRSHMPKLKTQPNTQNIKKRERGRLKKNGWRTDFFCLISAFARTLEQREEEGPGRCCMPGGGRDGISPGGVAMGMVRVGMVNEREGKRLPPALKICRRRD